MMHSPETYILIQPFRPPQPGKYIQKILDYPPLNPFLCRVRSIDTYAGNAFIHRHTRVWIHESLAEAPIPSSTIRRYGSTQGDIIEQVYVTFTDHRGLQLGPRRFDKMTEGIKNHTPIGVSV